MSIKSFKSGDIITFKDKEYIVIQNYGTTGLIKENCENGMIIKGFSWIQDGEECKYIGTQKKELDMIQNVNKEYEDFFEKYKL